MRTRPLAVFGAVAVIAASLTACTSGGSEPQAQEDIDLRMTMWSSNPDHLALFESIADDFMAEYPAVTSIEFESITLDQLDAVVTTGIAGGDAPDLSWMPVESSRQYIEAGALLDVAPVLKETDAFDYDDLIPELQTRWRDGEAQFGVPFSTSPPVMFYNKDVYAAAGVPSPADLIASGDWNWDSFREISRQLKESTGTTGYVIDDFDYKNWLRLISLMYRYDAEPWNEDATECTADSPEMVEAVSLYHDMVYVDGSSPLPGQQVDFWGGQAGATSAFLSRTALLADATFEWGIAPIPEGPDGGAHAVGQSAIVALKAGKHHDAAVAFLTFLTNKENTERLAQFFPPARTSLLDADVIAGTSPILTVELVEPVVDAVVEDGKIFPVAADSAAVAEAMNKVFDEHIWTPDADIESALGIVCEEIGPLLK